MSDLSIPPAVSSSPTAVVRTVAAPPHVPITPKQIAPAGDQLKLSTPEGAAPSVRFFFFSDAHSNQPVLNKFLAAATQERPDLVIDGGDFLHDGTAPEFKRALDQRAALPMPVHMVTGNHDAELRGPFPPDGAPHIPDFQSFDHKGVHFILIDNHDETLTDAQFKQLEADLESNKGKPTVVSMHVPPLFTKERATVKLIKNLPLHFASPQMTDEAQIKRFTDLMSKHQVKAVLSGHTHEADEIVKDGVRYLVAGSSGGLTPGAQIPNEYLDIALEGNDLKVERKQLDPGSAHLGEHLLRAGRFYHDLNTFNHRELGWDTSYVPSANIELRTGTKHTTRNGESNTALTGTLQAERVNPSGSGAAFAAVTVAAGLREQTLQLGAGYKHHVLGNYNKGVYVSGSVAGNAGLIQGDATAGVGAKAAIGGAWKNVTVEAGHEWATNYRATTLTVGYRF